MMIKVYLFSVAGPTNRFTNASSSPGDSGQKEDLFGIVRKDKAIFHRTADVRFLGITHMIVVYDCTHVSLLSDSPFYFPIK